MKRKLLAAALFTAFVAAGASAAPMMGPPGPPPGGGVPSAEMLATIPDLTPAQQADVRRILLQRRDSTEAAATKFHSQMEALHKQMRDEHERIETQTSDQLRKALGEDAYKRYAEWSVHHEHGPMGPDGHGFGPHGMHGPHGDDKAGPGSPPPGAGAGKPDDE